MDEKTAAMYFAVLNEIGIVAQLSRTVFEARLPEGLLTSHFGVVNHLVRLGDGVTPLALARAFQVPKTTMTHTSSILERHGFIRMAPNPEDGRSKCVFLTETGARFREDAIAGLAPDLVDLAQAIPPETVKRMLPDLAELRRYLDENRP